MPAGMTGDMRAAAALTAVMALLWISNTAAALLMMPVALAVAGRAGPEATAFRTAMALGVAVAASIGGMGTPIGTTPNLLLVPLAGALAAAMGLEPLALMLPATLAASLGLMLPAATPPDALALGTGQVSPAQMALMAARQEFRMIPRLRHLEAADRAAGLQRSSNSSWWKRPAGRPRARNSRSRTRPKAAGPQNQISASRQPGTSSASRRASRRPSRGSHST